MDVFEEPPGMDSRRVPENGLGPSARHPNLQACEA